MTIEHIAEHELDLCGLRCPLPIMKTAHKMKQLEPGERLHVLATDPGAQADFVAYSEKTGHELLRAYKGEEIYHFVLRKS